MLKNFFTNKILSFGDKFFWSLAILLVSVILIGLIFALFISPPDYVQGDSVRIMYVHVPASLLALASSIIISAETIIESGCFGLNFSRY